MTKDRQRTETPIIAVVGSGWSVETAFTSHGAYTFTIRDKKDEKAAIQFADGIVFTGGGDIDPLRYGEERSHPDVYGISKDRDDQEFRIAALAKKRGIPMFGICRGLQLLNVVHGGTLHQDIAQYTATHMSHYGGQHDIYLREGTGVQRHLNTMHVKGTSLHHQAVDRMGEGLLPAGASIDGLVEMIESADGVWPYVLATQFHPEMDYKDKDNAAAGSIFQHFVNVCATKAGRRKSLDIRKEGLWNARGFKSKYTPTVITPHHGSAAIETWKPRKTCSHGYSYHCASSDLCKFDSEGYIAHSGIGFTHKGSEELRRCSHGAVYHSTEDAGDGLPCHFDGRIYKPEEADDDIELGNYLDNIATAGKGWVWSTSLEAWVPEDHDSANDDSEDYLEWLKIQSKWNNMVREIHEDVPALDRFAEFDDLDGW